MRTRKFRIRRLSMATLGVFALSAAMVSGPVTAYASEETPAREALAAVDPSDQLEKIDVLALTDLHGHLEQTLTRAGAKKKKEGKPITASDIDDIGVGSLSCQINLARKANPNSVFVSVGDNIGGSAWISAATGDDYTIKSLNAMGLDLSALGNHEFDKGWRDLNSRISGGAHLDLEGKPVTGKNARVYTKPAFPYLANNVEGMNPPPAPSFIKTVAGVKIGFVGVLTEDMPNLVSKPAIVGLKFPDPAKAANAEAKKLRGQGAQVVIALAHSDAKDLAPKLNGGDINVLLGGHTHLRFESESITGADGKPLAALEAGSYGKMLGITNLVWNKTKNKLEKVQVRNMLPTEIDANCLKNGEPKVNALVTEAKAKADEIGAKVIGKLGGAFYKGPRAAESTMGVMIANAAAAGAKDLANPANLPVVGITNSGGLRADIVPTDNGDVTYGQLVTAQPFNNDLGYTELSGAELIKLLNQQWRSEGGESAFLKLGLSENMKYTFDPTLPVGSRITSVSINGKPLDKNGKVRVVGNSFLLMGGDNFTTFKQDRFTALGIIDLDALISYVEAHQSNGKLIGPDPVTRAVGISSPGKAKAGSQIEVQLSGLSMTKEKPDSPYEITVPKTVTLKMGGKSVGQASVLVEHKSADGTNGSAKVKVTLPKGLEGMQRIEIFTDLSGEKSVAEFGVNVITQADGPGGEETVDPKPTANPTGKPMPGSSLAKTGASAYALGVFMLLAVSGSGAVFAARRGMSRR